MNYTAVIYDEQGNPIVSVALTSLTTERRALAPLRLPDRWGASPTFAMPEDPERVSLEGYVTRRLSGNWLPPEEEPERQITIPP